MNGLEAIAKAYKLGTRYRAPCGGVWWKLTDDPTWTQRLLVKEGWKVEEALRDFWIDYGEECTCNYIEGKGDCPGESTCIHVREVRD